MPAYNLTPFHARLFRIGAAVALPLALCACKSFPHADFHAGFMGVEIGIDTRQMTDSVGDVSASMVRAVGIKPPVVDTSAAADPH